MEWKKAAQDNLNNISSDIGLKIYSRIQNHLVRAPKELGKALTGKYKGLYRYRYGDYRVLYEIYSDEKLIIINIIGTGKKYTKSGF